MNSQVISNSNLSPGLIIISGGVSRQNEKYFPYLKVQAELLHPRLRNQAGIIGAVCLAAERLAVS